MCEKFDFSCDLIHPPFWVAQFPAEERRAPGFSPIAGTGTTDRYPNDAVPMADDRQDWRQCVDEDARGSLRGFWVALRCFVAA